jgi:uncharacterized FlaG/YvyC family protein
MVAEALSDWLQRVIQAVKPFYSPDIDKGAKWSNEIDDALEGTRFGIICLTPDNLKSEWIHYEAGALSKTKDASIWTFLLNLKPSDVKQPLGRFQHTLAEKTDVLKMLKSINAKLVEVGGDSLKDNLLEEIFEESWAKLEVRLNKAKEAIKTQSNDEDTAPAENLRKESDKLDEILEILRTQQRLSISEEIDHFVPKGKTQIKAQTYSGILVHLSLNEKLSKVDEKYITDYLKQYLPVETVAQLALTFTSLAYRIIFGKPISLSKIKYGLEQFQIKTELVVEGFDLFE